MIRNLALTAVLATAIAHPALAQTTTVEPAAPAASSTEAPTPTTTTPAPDASPALPATASPTAAESMPGMMLTQQEAEDWIGKSVYSSDGEDLGDVAAFKRGDDNSVTEMHADIGGFLGFGQTRISLTPEQFDLNDDRATLAMSSVEAGELPAIVE
jgi:hypothetical protein